MPLKADRSAFPSQVEIRDDQQEYYTMTPGLTARQYAAIQLRVPDSGEPWLDKMIRQARRMDSNEQAMKGILSNPKIDIGQTGDPHNFMCQTMRFWAYWASDAINQKIPYEPDEKP